MKRGIEMQKLRFSVGEKFKDEHNREIELVEIDTENLDEPYIMSLFFDNQWNVSTYSENELDSMRKIV